MADKIVVLRGRGASSKSGPPLILYKQARKTSFVAGFIGLAADEFLCQAGWGLSSQAGGPI